MIENSINYVHASCTELAFMFIGCKGRKIKLNEIQNF